MEPVVRARIKIIQPSQTGRCSIDLYRFFNNMHIDYTIVNVFIVLINFNMCSPFTSPGFTTAKISPAVINCISCGIKAILLFYSGWLYI